MKRENMTTTKKPTKTLVAAIAVLLGVPLACSRDKEPETPEEPMTPASQPTPAPAPSPYQHQPAPSETPGTGTPSMDEGSGGTGTWGTDDMPNDSDEPESTAPSGGEIAPQGRLMKGSSSMQGTGGAGGTGGTGGNAGNGGNGGDSGNGGTGGGMQNPSGPRKSAPASR
jgi:hypothetical protein